MKNDEIFIVREADQYFSTTEILENQHKLVENKVLNSNIIEANHFISQQLEIPLASKLFFIRRLRIVEKIPRSIEKVFIDYNRVEGIENIDFTNKSFYRLIQDKYGLKVIKKQDEIMIVHANDEERKLLELPDDSEISFIKGVTYVDQNSPFEYFEDSAITSFYRFRSTQIL